MNDTKLCNKLVSQIVRLTGETHKKVHYRSYEEGGCKRKIFSSIQDMELKKNWLEQEFLKQKKYK